MNSSVEKKRVALTSILAAILITGMKLVVGLLTNSLGLLSEAAHSGLDLVAALMTYFAVSIADRPPDADHQYGHGKVENVSAFVETLILVVTCIWIVVEAIRRLVSHEVEVEANIWSFVVIVLSIILDLGRSRALNKIAKKYNSQALEADALHFSSDVWSSSVVLAGLFFVRAGYIWMDAIAAIAVAILVLVVSYRLGRRTVDALMDRVPDGVSEKISRAIAGAEGVGDVRALRLRQSGAKLFVDTTVGIRRTIPFNEVHVIMDRIEQAVHAAHAGTDVVVHAEPFESSDESIADKVRMIVLGRGLRPPHNLEVHQSGGKYHIDFDIEYHPGKTLREAHDLTSEIEAEIRAAVPSAGNVTIHMEEIQSENPSTGSSVENEGVLHDQIRATVLGDRRVTACPGVNLLNNDGKYTLSLVCTFGKARTLGEVHDIICDLETVLYKRFRMLRRITVHAEPSE